MIFCQFKDVPCFKSFISSWLENPIDFSIVMYVRVYDYLFCSIMCENICCFFFSYLMYLYDVWFLVLFYKNFYEFRLENWLFPQVDPYDELKLHVYSLFFLFFSLLFPCILPSAKYVAIFQNHAMLRKEVLFPC